MPVEIVGGVRIDWHDLCIMHEEADIVITQHAISCSLSDKCVRVVCDDTDVLVLLVHVYHIKCRGRNSAPMIISFLVKELAVIDIRTTATAHSGLADDLLTIHGISGADTVASLHGVGKATVIKIALSKVGDVKADMKSVQAQATKFTCAAYVYIHDRMQGQDVASKTGKLNSPPFHQPVIRSSTTSTDVTCNRNMESSTSRTTTDNGPNKSWLGTRPPGHPATTNSANRHNLHLQIY